MILLYLAAITLAAAPAPAAEPSPAGPDLESLSQMSLEELLQVDIYTAAKTKQQLEQAPSVVTVITDKEIRQRGYRTVAEALQAVQGFYVIDDGVNQNVSVRGLAAGTDSANGIIKVMINGQPIAFGPTSDNNLGYDLIPVEAIKRIEVVRGPDSAIYGANALMGVVNVITYDGSDVADGGVGGTLGLRGYLSENDAQQTSNGGATVTHGFSSGRFQYFVAGTLNDANRSGMAVPGYGDMVNKSLGGTAQGYPSPGLSAADRVRLLNGSPSANDYDRSGSAYGIARLSLGSLGTVSVDGSYQSWDRYGEFQDYSFLTHDNRLTQVLGYGRVRLDLDQWKSKGLTFNLSLSYGGGSPTHRERIADPHVDGIYERRAFGNEEINAALEGQWQPNEKHTFILGLDFQHDHEDLLDMHIFNRMTGAELVSADLGDKDFDNSGLYAQWQWNPIEHLGFTLGGRLDHNSLVACDRAWNCFGSETQDGQAGGFAHLSNRAAAVYQLPVSKLYAKAIYSTSFKPASPFQLYHNPITSVGTLGNPDLRPQEASTYELEVGDKPTRWLQVSANYYNTFVKDVVMALPASEVTGTRNTDAQLQGVEAEVKVIPSEHFSAYANANYQIQMAYTPQKNANETDAYWASSFINTTFPGGGYPGFSVRVGANLALPEQHLDVNGNVYVIGERNAYVANAYLRDALSLGSPYTFPTYVMLDVTLSTLGLEFIKNRETSFQLNLREIPASVAEPGVRGVDLPGSPTQLTLKVSQQF